LVQEILDIAAKFNRQKNFSNICYWGFCDKSSIFGTPTDSDIVKLFHEQNIPTMDSGSVTGMNGLIIGITKLDGIKGICLLGETSRYDIDAKHQSPF
jgi:proteasome assembly chaperone (PAC2) family protein